MLKKKSEKSFHEQMKEAKASGDMQKWMEVSRRASMAWKKELYRLRRLKQKEKMSFEKMEAQLKKDSYNKKE